MAEDRLGTDALRRGPRHRQVEAALRARLAAGVPPVGALLPREVDLAAELGVSRSVVRQALDALERDGLVQRRRHGGTRVLRAGPAPLIQDLAGVYGLAQGTLSVRVQSRVLALGLVPADSETARLGVDAAGRVLRAERLRLVDDGPLALEEVYLPATLAAVLGEAALAQGSLYAHLATLGWPAARAEEQVAAVALEGRAAGLLNQPLGAPALLVERLTFGPAGPIERRRTLYRADRYRLRARLAAEALLAAGPAAERGVEGGAG
jgi:GntR family transcriptional regulator